MAEIKIEVDTTAPAIEGLVNVINGPTILLVFDQHGETLLSLASSFIAKFFLHVRGQPSATVGLKITMNGTNLIRARTFKIPAGGELGESVEFTVP